MEKEKQSDVDLAREKEKMDNFNLAALQRLDDKIVRIVGSAGHVALYTFHADKQEWERKEVEGSLFVAARSVPPYHQVVVLNRLNTDNFIEPVTSDLEMEVIQPYLLFRNKNEEITGVWFYKKVEQTKISEVIQGLLKNLTNQEKPKGKASSSPRPDRVVKSSTDNANPQKDNKDPEQNTNLKDNQGQQRRGGAVKKVTEREELSSTSTAAALRQSRDATSGDRRQNQEPLAVQPKPQPSQPPQQLPQQPQQPQQPQPQQLQPQPKPQVPQPQPQQHLSPIQQLHSSLQQQYQFPPSPYAFPPPQQPQHHGGPFPPPHFSPYHHGPPHNYPQFPFPVPLQQLLQPNQPGPHYPPPQQQPQPQQQPPQPQPSLPQQPPQQSPLPFLQPPPGLAPSPQGRGESSAQQQPPPQRLLSPEFLVQQLSRPPASVTTTTQPSQTQKPPITKENIRELLASLVQDDRFITMVHTAYLQQLQKEGS